MSDFDSEKATAHNAAEGGASPTSSSGEFAPYGVVRNANQFRDIQTGDNKKITPAASSVLDSIVIVQEINAPTMCQVVFEPETAWTKDDFEQFEPGRKLVIPDKAIHDAKLPSMYISGIALAGNTGQGTRMTLTVTAFDKMHFLRFGQYSKSFVGATDKSIFEWLAQVAKLTLSADDKVLMDPYSYVLLDNETCYDFLLRRCRQGHYECMVKLQGDDEALVVGPRAYEASALDPPLFYNYDIEAVNLDVRVPTLGEAITAWGYDIEQGESVSGVDSEDLQSYEMNGKQSAFAASGLFSASPVNVRRPDLTNKKSLKDVATSERIRFQDTFVEGSVTLRQINLRAYPGANVTLNGINASFDGLYHIVKSTHRIDRSRNFTILNLTRSGMWARP